MPLSVWSSVRDQVHRLHRMPTNRLGIYPKDVPADAGWLSWPEGETVALRVRRRMPRATATRRGALALWVDSSGRGLERHGHGVVARREWHPSSSLPGQGASGFALEWAGNILKLKPCACLSGHGSSPLSPPWCLYRNPSKSNGHPVVGDAWAVGMVGFFRTALASDRWLAVQREEGEVVARAVLTSGKVHVSLKEAGSGTLERDSTEGVAVPQWQPRSG